MTIAEKLATVAENIPKVYAAGQSSMVDESKIIEKNVSGAFISVDDVSEIPHSVGCKVSGVDDPTSVKVTRCGKNIFDKSNIITGKRLATDGNLVPINDDSIPSETKMMFTSEYIEIEPNKNLTFSTNMYSYKHRLCYYEQDKKFISVNETETNTVTTPVNARYLRFNGYLSELDAFVFVESSTATEYTPNADGTVEGMTSLSPYMNVFTDNADVTLDVTYRKSWGMQTEYDRFWNAIWDGIQLGGKRTQYISFFKYEYWNEETFRPKYDMRLTENNSYMFDRFGGMSNTTTKSIDLAQIFEECGVVLDTSQCTYLNNLFYFSSVSRVPAISAVGCTSTIIGVFAQCLKLVTVDKFILKEDGSNKFSNIFLNDVSLRNIIIEGTMGDSVSFESCPLSKDSILSVFNSLSDTITGKTLTLKLSAVNTAFETSAGAADGSTSAEWQALIGTKPNWTIALA